MGLLGWLFGKRGTREAEYRIRGNSAKQQLNRTSPPEDSLYMMEIKNLTGCEVLLKALQAAKQYKHESLPAHLRSWFVTSMERLSTCPPSTDELDRITQAILDTSEMYEYSPDSFDSWYEKILRDLPLGAQVAVIDAVAQKDNKNAGVYLHLVKRIGGERSTSFFAKLRQDCISRAKAKHTSDWNSLSRKIQNLPLVSLSEADEYLRKEARTDGVSPYYAGAVGWTVGHALHLFNIEDLLLHAVERTSANNGNFAQLVRGTKIHHEPIPHLRAPYSWGRSEDAYGTNTFFALRIGDKEFLCADTLSYG